MRSMTQLLDEKAVSTMTGLPIRRLQQLRFRNAGPSYRKLGRAVRYVGEEVQAWLDSCRVTPGAKTETGKN